MRPNAKRRLPNEPVKQQANLTRLPRYLFFTNGFSLAVSFGRAAHTTHSLLPGAARAAGVEAVLRRRSGRRHVSLGRLRRGRAADGRPGVCGGRRRRDLLSDILVVARLRLLRVSRAALPARVAFRTRTRTRIRIRIQNRVCCSGCKKSYGYLCPGEPRESVDDAYSPRSVWMTRGALVIVALMLVIAFIIMQVGNGGVGSGIDSFATATTEKADRVRAQPWRFGRALVRLNPRRARSCSTLPGKSKRSSTRSISWPK